MKKKIALLMAAAMTLTMLPMTVFASANNILVGGVAQLSDTKTEFAYDFNGPGGSLTAAEKTATYANIFADNNETSTTWGIAKGASVNINVGTVAMTTGQQFYIDLQNGTFDTGYNAQLTNAGVSLWTAMATVIDTTAINSAMNNAAVTPTNSFLSITPWSGGNRRAYFKVLETVPANTVITVPLNIKTTQNSQNVIASVNPGDTNLVATDLTVATPGTGSTTFKITGTDTLKGTQVVKLNISETKPGAIKVTPAGTMQTVTYKLPYGFAFGKIGYDAVINPDATNLQDYVTGTNALSLVSAGAIVDTAMFGIDSDIMFGDANVSVSKDFRTLTLKYSVTQTSTTAGGFTLKNVQVIPTSDAKYGDIAVSVNGNSYGIASTTTPVSAGKYVNWSSTFTQADSTDVPADLISGRLEFNVEDRDGYVQTDDKKVFDDTKTNTVDLPEGGFADFDNYHKTITATFQEQVANSWWSGRKTTFTMPAGVEIIQARIDKASYTYLNEGRTTSIEAIGNNGYMVYDQDKNSNNFEIKDNVLTLKNIYTSQTDTAKFNITFWVAAPANFTGNVDCVVGGDSIAAEDTSGASNTGDVNVDALPALKLATFTAPYVVSTKVTNVEIGYQSYDVADITITETEKGRFFDTDTVYVSLDDLTTAGASSANLIFRSLDANVTSGDLIIKNVQSSSNNRAVQFDIASGSSSDSPSTVTLTNCKISMDRNIPVTNDVPFNVTVTTDNKQNDKDETSSIRYGDINAPYINVVTNGFGLSNGTVITVTVGSATATVGGNDVDMGTAAFIDPATDRLMVPVRFISEALGSGVQWDQNNQTVTMINGNRAVQFKVGATTYILNGIEVPTDNGAVTQNLNGRVFVPFRTLGQALNVSVRWDAATQTAFFNDGPDAVSATADQTNA